ncbi:MAG: PAS domain S-box protein [Anaerolineales bacterium]|nr:PAS domain S-box protein [Anaerolineales bacterium]
MIKKILKSIFDPPVFEPEEKEYHAYLLTTLLWTLLLASIPYFCYALFTAPIFLSRILFQIVLHIGVSIFLFYLIRRGFVQTASYIEVITLWALLTVSAVTDAGVYSLAYTFGYALVIIIAGILLGFQFAFLTTLVSVAAGGWMLYADAKGLIVFREISSPASFWMLSAIIFSILIFLQYIFYGLIQRALKRARASEERYKLILSVSSDYIFESSIDAAGHNRLIWVGGAFERLTGYTFEEYIAAGGWVAHLHPADVEKDAEDLATLKRNQSIISDVRTIAKNGELCWVRISARPIWNAAENRVTGVIGSAQDVTNTKVAEEAEKISLQLQVSMIENVPDMAWLKDLNSRYLAVNEKFSEFEGLKREEVVGKTDYELSDRESAEAFRAADALVIATQKPSRIEEKVKDVSGREYWVETIKTPIFNSKGAVIGTSGIARDIQARKEIEFTQQRRRELLEKVIELGKTVTVTSSLTETVKQIWHGVHDTLEFDRLAIFLYNAETLSVDGTIGTDRNGQMEEVRNVSFPISREATNRLDKVLENPGGMYFTHNYSEENNIDAGDEMYGVKDYVAIAAWVGSKPIAVICADHALTHRPITEEQLEALRLFSGYAALAIENSRLYEKLQDEILQKQQDEEREKARSATLEEVVKLGQYVTESNKIAPSGGPTPGAYELEITLIRIWQGVRYGLGFDRIGIYLYDAEKETIQGTFGTNNQGEMTDEWASSTSTSADNPAVTSFLEMLHTPNAIYATDDYERDHPNESNQAMAGVKDFMAIAARAGDKPVAILCVDNNITKRPISEQQIESLRLFAGYAGLAIENSRLNTALQSELTQRKNFIQELETKNAELERFTYTVSHDLRSPLVTISGFLGYIEKDARAGNLDKVHHSAIRIIAAVEKMQRLLNDLLELSRIGRLINPPVEIPFNQIVEDTVEILQGQLQKGGVKIEYQPTEIVIYGDQTRLTEALQNLIENAIKFMEAQPAPLIQIGVSSVEAHEYTFYVKDNGIGIEPEYHEKIFGLFNKLDAQSHGTGIGLTLVKRIIEVHGGRIWVESQPKQGAAFYFTLPR